MDQQYRAESRLSPTRIGLLLALAGFMVLSAGDGLVKSTAGHWPGTAVAALRYVIGTAVLGAVVLATRGWAGFRVSRPGVQLGRGAAVAFATLSFFTGAQLMPLADATAIQFTSPIFVAMFSALLLGERAPREAWTTTAIALAGVAIVLRPNIAALGPAALLPVMAAAGMAVLVVLNRCMAGLSDILSQQFWLALMATPLLILATAIGHLSGIEELHVSMPSLAIVLKCAGAAATGTAAHWLIYAATEHASAPVIAPMVYVQLLFATVIGWTMFHNRVDMIGAAGMLLIILSSLLLWRSQRNPVAANAPD